MYIAKGLYKQILDALPIACVDLLIIKNDKCLLLLRNNEPAKNMYWFPGGRIHKNESIQEAALRKAKEETNLDCRFIRVISVEESVFPKKGEMLTDVHTLNICCLLEVDNISYLRPDQLHSNYLWIDHLDEEYHSAVNNPLSLVGFKFKD